MPAGHPAGGQLPSGHPKVEGKAAFGFRDTQAEAYASYMYGLLLADEGRQKEAIGYFQMASQLDSGSPEILDQLMRGYMAEGKSTEAEQTAEKILKLSPQWTDAHVVLGQIYLETERPIEAVNHLEIALELAPERTNIIFLLADGLEKMGDFERAIESLEELSESEDHQAISHYYIARLRLRSGELQPAVDSLVKAIALNPSFLKGVGELGGQLENRGKNEEAIELYETYLEKDPDKIAVREFLARALIREKRYDEARHQAGMVLEATPENTGAMLLMGLAEAHDGEPEKALEIFTKVRQVAPDNFDMVLQIGILQRQLEMHEASIATLMDAARIAPDRYEPHLNLSVNHDISGDLDKAVDSAQTALVLAPDHINIRTYLAQLLMKKDRLEEAMEILRQGLTMTPEDTSLLYQLAIVQDRRGQFDKAVEVLLQIIKIDSNHYDALNYLGYSWAERGINLERSLDLVKKALEIKPDAAYIIDSLGWVYYQMERYEEALEHLLKAGKEMEGDPTVLEHIGDTYDKLGKVDLAAEFWSLALEADPGNASISDKLKNKGSVGTTP
jgi:tetratricopeptide (TPR) repeat protein